jgi:DivIVA domain-containing protein
MAEHEPASDGDDVLDPEEVSGRSFPTAFRGFDPVQVRAFLQTVADELRKLHEREDSLRKALAEGSGVDDATKSQTTANADAAVEEAVPSEVADAKAEADRMLKDARDRVATLGTAATAEATRVLEEARAEAARLRATATDDLKGRFEEAEATAVRKIAEAEREAASIRVKAREEADATIEAARDRGREMVAEAQAARERMLADLAKRKRSAQAQLEQLRAGRDRLLDTLKVARRSIDEMTTRFDANEGGSASSLTPPSSGVPSGPVSTTPGIASTDARPRPATTTSISTSPNVARPVRTRAVAIGEAPGPRPAIAAPQAESFPEPPSPASVEAPVTARDDPAQEVAPPQPAPPPPVTERKSSALRILRRNRGGDGPPPTPPLIGRDSPAEGVRIIGRQPDAPPIEATVPEPAPELPVPPVVETDVDVDLDALLANAPVESPPAPIEPAPNEADRDDEVASSLAEPPPVGGASPASEPAIVSTSATAADESEAPAPLAREEIRPRIEDLFARIRADRERTTASAREVLAKPDDARVLVADVPAEVPTSDADESRLQARDALTEPLAGQLTKRMKRALQDEQNATLDRLRTSRGSLDVDHLLSSRDDQRSPYRALAHPFLEQAGRAGSSASPFGAVAVAVDDLAQLLAEDLADALRSRLDTVVTAAASEGLDLAGLGERISSVYREWKVQKLERLAMHYLVAAHERGGFLAQPEGTPLRWLVDDEGPCPDCDDNALAGPTPRGEAFPTGQLHPPAHLGCRCLLTPARN